MKIKCVTLTGADDQTSFEGMQELSNKYSYLEWAILFSQSKSGTSRYPTWDWVEKLTSTVEGNFSAHMCGKYVDDAIEQGRLTCFSGDNEFVGEHFQRVQFNLSGGRLPSVLKDPSAPIWHIRETEFQVIFGGPFSEHMDLFDPMSFTSHGIAPMFDSSGGRGVLSSWPKIPHHEYGPLWCGYAGGLGPKNISQELLHLEDAVGDAVIWIDMETRLRNEKDEFDLGFCEIVLEAVKPYVEDACN